MWQERDSNVGGGEEEYGAGHSTIHDGGTRRRFRGVPHWDAYQQGLTWFHKNSADAFAQAAKHFERAINLDTNFAAAYAQLAITYGWTDPSDRRKMLEKSRSLAKQALALDDKSLDARLALAWTKAVIDHDWSGADKDYRYAIKLNPSSED